MDRGLIFVSFPAKAFSEWESGCKKFHTCMFLVFEHCTYMAFVIYPLFEDMNRKRQLYDQTTTQPRKKKETDERPLPPLPFLAAAGPE